jgi:hypothetical protein
MSGSKIHQALKARFNADRHLFDQGSDARLAGLKRAYSPCSVGNRNSWGDIPG